GVDLLAIGGQVPPHGIDPAIRNCDVGVVDTTYGHHPAAADDHRRASCSRNRDVTSSAISTSSVVTDSAGWWLTPPLQRTNSIAIPVRLETSTPSWPAPLVNLSAS